MASLSSIVRNIMAIDPAAPALEYGKVWHSWGELNGIIEAIESIYKVEGIAPGTRIGGILRNTPQIAAVIIGTIGAGLFTMLVDEPFGVTTNPKWLGLKVLLYGLTVLAGVLIVGIGIDVVEPQRVARLLEKYGERFAPPKLLRDLAAKGEPLR